MKFESNKVIYIVLYFIAFIHLPVPTKEILYFVEQHCAKTS